MSVADPALAMSSPGVSAAVPPNFVDAQVVGGLANPTLMALAPDGRIFVSEQAGRVRIIKNGALLPTPFVNLSVNSAGERGALGIAFDPAFATNGFVYVYYANGSHAPSRFGGYTGSGYARFTNATADYIEWTIHAPTAGLTAVEFRYSLGAFQPRTVSIMLNGVVARPNASFAPTGGGSVWRARTINLNLRAGTNTIRMTATGTSGPNVDYLIVRGPVTPGQ